MRWSFWCFQVGRRQVCCCSRTYFMKASPLPRVSSNIIKQIYNKGRSKVFSGHALLRSNNLCSICYTFDNLSEQVLLSRHALWTFCCLMLYETVGFYCSVLSASVSWNHVMLSKTTHREFWLKFSFSESLCKSLIMKSPAMVFKV